MAVEFVLMKPQEFFGAKVDALVAGAAAGGENDIRLGGVHNTIYADRKSRVLQLVYFCQELIKRGLFGMVTDANRSVRRITT